MRILFTCSIALAFIWAARKMSEGDDGLTIEARAREMYRALGRGHRQAAEAD